MSETIVHRLHEDFTALTDILNSAVEPSLSVTANDCFRKALLLAAASHFESQVVGAIMAYIEEVASQNPLVVEFVRKKALSRQYHTLFTWDGNSANSFFGHFGPSFKKYAEQRVKADPALQSAVQSFLELGDLRNRLVHQDFGNFTLEKTADEIFQAFQVAEQFVAWLPALFRECPISGQLTE